MLCDYDGDIDALKSTKPWLLADAPVKLQGGKTGLPNAGTSTDAGKTKRFFVKITNARD